MPIVTISRQYGSGGSELAERVANALGWQLYDNAVVDEVASRLGMTSAAVSAREERMPTLGERLASAISLSAPEVMPTVGEDAMPPSEERIVEVTRRVMEEAVQSGNAVIVGRGAPALLETRSDALHVLCCAPLDALIAYAVTNLGVPPGEARKKVLEMNARRGEYVRRHWQREWLDVSNYHLCVNTALMGLDGAADLVIRVAEERFS
ncbi:MAG: cytidylate kinase-like family protein [Gemmatimonadota bacterium]